MKIDEVKCPNCAGTLQFSEDRTTKICPYCDAVFMIQSMQTANTVDVKSDVKTVQIKNPTEIVQRICANSGFNSIYGAIGFSLIGTNKFNNAKKNFGIVNGEDAYLIFDATIFGGCKKGFAVCTNGFYYSANGLNAYVITWNDFKAVSVVKRRGFLIVGNAEFNSGNDCIKLYDILTSIKNSL